MFPSSAPDYQPAPPEVAALLAISDERDQQDRRRLAEVQAAYREGWRACVADYEHRAQVFDVWRLAPPRDPFDIGDIREVERSRTESRIARAEQAKAHRGEAA